MLGHIYPPYRLRPDRGLARKFMSALGVDTEPGEPPPTYLGFVRGEHLGVNLFKDLDIPREKALHGGQRYEWFAPVSFDDEFDVTVRVDKIVEKENKRGKIWFADVTFEYRFAKDGKLAVREVTRLVKQS
ncbi:MAG: FAS1-like dehydratase domain-containing protein [Bradyrhizobium sp.]